MGGENTDGGLDLTGKRICFIAGTLGQGGAERQLYYIVRSLKEKGARPLVLSITSGEVWESRIRAIGVPVKWVGRRRIHAVRLMRIIREIYRFRPHVVQAQHFSTSLHGAVAGRLLRIPSIGAIRNNAFFEMNAMGSVAGRLSVKLPNVMAANSRQAIQNALSLGVPQRKMFFLPNVVDTDRFKPVAGPGMNKPLILAVGRLYEQKRFDILLEALCRMAGKGCADFECRIVGEGTLRQELEHQAERLGIARKVVFAGNCDTMEKLYTAADMLVLTSDHEGTPNVVLEAMASGLPVVATEVGGVPDLLEHGRSGFLCRQGDVDGIASSLARLAADGAMRDEMGSAARDRIEKHHGFDSLWSNLRALYRMVLEARGARRADRPGVDSESLG